MKKISMALTCLFFFSAAGAQQYIIRYDPSREEVKYLMIKKKGDTTTTPVIRLTQTRRVNLQLVNTSGSYQRAITYIDREEIQEKVVIPGLGSSPVTHAADGVLDLDVKNYSQSEIFRVSNNKDVSSLIESNEQRSAKSGFANRLNSFLLAYAEWRSSLLFFKESERLWTELARLRYSLNYSGDETRQRARQAIHHVFPGIGDNYAEIPLRQEVLDAGQGSAAVFESYSRLQLAYSTLGELDINSREADSLYLVAGKAAGFVRQAALSSPDQFAGSLFSRISELYGQILQDPFSQVVPMNINRLTIIAELTLIPLIDSVTAAALGIQKTDTIRKWIPVVKKEPLQFRNTVGFSFVSFAENRWDYYVRQDSTLARETADQFQPVIVTYLHFYSPRDRGFRWGGSFGAGIPVGSDNSKLNLLVGISSFLGRGDPICFTVGACGAQVKKLSGYLLGDKIQDAVLTAGDYHDVYRIGYFVSLTFNPASLNKRD